MTPREKELKEIEARINKTQEHIERSKQANIKSLAKIMLLCQKI